MPLVSFSATGLSRYYIAIDGFNGATGDTTLNWSFQAGADSHVSQRAYPARASVINASALGYRPGALNIFVVLAVRFATERRP